MVSSNPFLNNSNVSSQILQNYTNQEIESLPENLQDDENEDYNSDEEVN